MMSYLTADDVIGRKVLIVGDVGRGKTKLTARLLEAIAERLGLSSVTVIDMAPTTLPDIGARLSAYTDVVQKIRYFAPPVIRGPRLEGKTADEVLELAEANRAAIEPLLDAYLANPTPILVVNDLSIYLHAGDLRRVLECARVADTFLANAYSGTTLSDDKGSGVTEREKSLLNKLVHQFDLTVRL